MLGPVNVEMIVLGRQSRGWSQDVLARKVGRSAALLSRIEHGITGATLPVIEDIAAALRYPTSFFFRSERVRGSDSICFHHRKRESMPIKLLTTIEAQMHVTQLQVSRLLEDLEIESPNTFVTLDPDEYDRNPQRVAQMLRSLWRLPRGPIPNLVRVLEAAGCVVVFRHFGTPKLDGMSCWAPRTPPLFFINAAIPTDRARLTLAHELGHLVMHSTAPGDPEAEANEFASEFLMPSADSASDIRNLRFANLPGLKAKWRLSMAAIVMAASRRGTVPNAQSLWVQMSRHGYRAVEPYPIEGERPTIVDKAMRVHVEEHEYSPEELAKLTDLYPEEFNSLYGKTSESYEALSVLS